MFKYCDHVYLFIYLFILRFQFDGRVALFEMIHGRASFCIMVHGQHEKLKSMIMCKLGFSGVFPVLEKVLNKQRIIDDDCN